MIIQSAPFSAKKLRQLWLSLQQLGLAKSLDPYGLRMLLLSMLWERLYSSPNNIASAPELFTYYNFFIIVGVSGIFGENIIMAPLAGRLSHPETPEEEKSELRRKIEESYHAGLLYSVLYACVVIPPFVQASPILQGLGQEPAVADAVQSWTRLLALDVLTTGLYISAEQPLTSFQQSRALLFGVGSVVLSCSIGAFLVFGPPKLDPAMVTLCAFIAVSYLTTLAYTLSLKFAPVFKDFSFFEHLLQNLWTNKWGKLKNLLSASKVISFCILAEMLFAFGLSTLSGRISLTAQAGYAIPSQFSQINLSVSVNFALASMILLFGVHQPADYYPTAVYSGLFALLPALVIPIFMLSSPHLACTFLNVNNPVIQEAAREFIPYCATSELFKSLIYICLFQMRTHNDYWIPAWIHLGGLTIGMAVSTAMTLNDMGEKSIYAGQLIGTGSVALALLAREHRGLAPSRALFEAEGGSLLTPITETLHVCKEKMSQAGRVIYGFFSKKSNPHDPTSIYHEGLQLPMPSTEAVSS